MGKVHDRRRSAIDHYQPPMQARLQRRYDTEPREHQLLQMVSGNRENVPHVEDLYEALGGIFRATRAT